MMEKDRSIIQLLERLKLSLNFFLLEIVDYWDADLCAIGLKRDNRLIYVSTYNYVEAQEMKYDYDLEFIGKYNGEKGRKVKEGRGVSETELVNEIKEFLRV